MEEQTIINWIRNKGWGQPGVARVVRYEINEPPTDGQHQSPPGQGETSINEEVVSGAN